MTLFEPATIKGVAAAVSAVISFLSRPAAGQHVHLGQSEAEPHKDCAEQHWEIKKTMIFNDDPAIRMFDVSIVVEYLPGSGRTGEVRSELGYKWIAPRDSKTYEWHNDRVLFNNPDPGKPTIAMRIEWTDGRHQWAKPYRGKAYRRDGLPGRLHRVAVAVRRRWLSAGVQTVPSMSDPAPEMP